MSQAKTTAGIRRAVYEGRLTQTKGGLTADDLMENKAGKIVSKKASRAAKERMRNNPKIKKAFAIQRKRMKQGLIKPKSQRKSQKKRKSQRKSQKKSQRKSRK